MYSFKKASLSVFKVVAASTQASKVMYAKRNVGIYQRLWSKTSGYLEQFQEPIISPLPDYNPAERIPTKSERDLLNYLNKEIVMEQKAQKIKVFPLCIDGFAIKMKGAEIELNKQMDGHRIFIKLNVTNTVDTNGGSENEQCDGRPLEMAEIRSKPRFEVDFIKGSTTLSFSCSFLKDTAVQEIEYNDVYGIDEICLFEGLHSDDVYAVTGDVLDDNFYDLLMNFMEEKGINNEFARKLSDLATAYEHSLYIKLLENLSKFATHKN